MQPTRRNKGGGSLIVRRGLFWCRVRSHGQEHYLNTGIKIDMRDDKGQPIGRKMALAVLDNFAEPFKLRQAADTLAVLRARFEKSLNKAHCAAAAADAPVLSSLAELFTKSMRRNEMSKARLNLYTSDLQEFARWAGENKLAETVTEIETEKYAKKLWAGNITSDTFNAKIIRLQHVWNVLSQNFQLASNPWEGIKRKKKGKSLRRALTKEEISAIYTACGDKYGGDLRVLMMLGANTGLRLGDCATLKWSEINFKDGILRRKTIKTGAIVTIPLLPELQACLKSHRKRLLGEYKAARASGWNNYWNSKPARNTIVRAANTPDEAHTQYTCPRMCAVYEKSKSHMVGIVNSTFKKAGIETSKKEGRCSQNRPVATFHSFRHGFASRLAEAGVSERIAMQILGHNSAVVHENYVHLQDEYIKREMKKLEKEDA